MKYIRYDAPPELRLRYHFRDKFGNDILNARDYDPKTGVAHILPYKDAPEDTPLIEVFKPGGYVEIDGHINPSPETLDAIFANSKAVLDKAIMDATVKRIEQEVRFREKRS